MRVFISYRRRDAAYPAQQIYQEVRARVGSEQVVFDVDSIPPGADYREYLKEQVEACDILLAVIGDQWLDILTERADEDKDFVRIELRSALASDLLVIPVLVGAASVPEQEVLPADLAGLAFRNAVELRAGQDLDAHMKRLVEGLDRALATHTAAIEAKRIARAEATEAETRRRDAEDAAAQREARRHEEVRRLAGLILTPAETTEDSAAPVGELSTNAEEAPLEDAQDEPPPRPEEAETRAPASPPAGRPDTGLEALAGSEMPVSPLESEAPEERESLASQEWDPVLRSTSSVRLAGVVAAGLLAASLSYFVVWPAMQGESARGSPAGAEAVLPDLAPALEPPLQRLSDQAIADWFSESLMGTSPRPSAAPDEWLLGMYLANASDFEAAETFWSGVQRQLLALRSVEGVAFRDALAQGVSTESFSDADRAAILARGTAGFAATRAERAASLQLLQDVIDASLALHSFLVANEANIDYAPAATMTTDPILEAISSSPEIRDAMEERIDRVTESLSALDYFDLVTADGLWSVVLERVQEVGIR